MEGFRIHGEYIAGDRYQSRVIFQVENKIHNRNRAEKFMLPLQCTGLSWPLITSQENNTTTRRCSLKENIKRLEL